MPLDISSGIFQLLPFWIRNSEKAWLISFSSYTARLWPLLSIDLSCFGLIPTFLCQPYRVLPAMTTIPGAIEKNSPYKRLNIMPTETDKFSQSTLNDVVAIMLKIYYRKLTYWCSLMFCHLYLCCSWRYVNVRYSYTSTLTLQKEDVMWIGKLSFFCQHLLDSSEQKLPPNHPMCSLPEPALPVSEPFLA